MDIGRGLGLGWTWSGVELGLVTELWPGLERVGVHIFNYCNIKLQQCTDRAGARLG